MAWTRRRPAVTRRWSHSARSVSPNRRARYQYIREFVCYTGTFDLPVPGQTNDLYAIGVEDTQDNAGQHVVNPGGGAGLYLAPQELVSFRFWVHTQLGPGAGGALSTDVCPAFCIGWYKAQFDESVGAWTQWDASSGADADKAWLKRVECPLPALLTSGNMPLKYGTGRTIWTSHGDDHNHARWYGNMRWPRGWMVKRDEERELSVAVNGLLTGALDYGIDTVLTWRMPG